MQKAKFWKLCVAYLVDIILCQIVGFFAGGLAGGITGFLLAIAGLYTPDNRALFALLTALAGGLAGLVVFVLYFAICESCWQKTLGKKLMGLQVVQEVPQAQQLPQDVAQSAQEVPQQQETK